MSERFDVLIAGSGIVGLALAASLKSRLCDAVSVCVCDPGPPIMVESQRASAIAPDGVRLLRACGAWESVEPLAQPIFSMHVSDSRPDDKTAPVFLNFDAQPGATTPLAHMVYHHDLDRTLRARCAENNVQFRSDRVERFSLSRETIRAETTGGAAHAARLLVAADGSRSSLRAQAGITTVGWSYKQAAIVATLQHDHDHCGKAFEHFLPAGVLAVLPMPGNRSSIVWTEQSEIAERIVRLSPEDFRAELQRRLAGRMGSFDVIGRPASFPLTLQIARSFTARRFALAGDAAHVIHPLAGQGLNLGLRDAAALAGAVQGAMALGLDPGADTVLHGYQSDRRAESFALAGLTDSLNRLFSNDIAPIRMLRDLGLGLVERSPSLKRFLMHAATDGLAR